jgi:PAS domain S-box-containing protein
MLHKKSETLNKTNKKHKMIPNIAVILTDAARRIMWVNDDFTEITGYALNEVVGKKPSILQGPGSEQEVIRRIRQNLNDQVPFREQITNYRKNGEQYLCELVIHPVFSDQNTLTNFIAFEVDGNVVPNVEALPILKVDEKYRSSSLKGVDEIKLFYRMKRVIEEEQLYLNPDLTLKIVADHLHTNTKYLSQVVNHHAGCNFQQFINYYRVEEVKKKITEPELANLTLFGVALQCGFKNKSTFYKVFKDITNMTPKAFLKHHKSH